ncbi:hypothetical protein AAC03nite_28330 [Alicyclobacillus acidoterrestris]|nr:hypothetical protein AAC03nite_28330 [Alicyclobacillus acidoterrestris]
MSKQDEAVAKIRAELAANNNNSYVQTVGDFLLQHLEEHPEFAGNILAPGKTILKSLDAMRKVAEKKKVGNCAVLTSAEGFAVVIDYFRTKIEAQVPERSDKKASTSKPKKPEPEPEPVVEPEDDDIDFDALLL